MEDRVVHPGVHGVVEGGMRHAQNPWARYKFGTWSWSGWGRRVLLSIEDLMDRQELMDEELESEVEEVESVITSGVFTRIYQRKEVLSIPREVYESAAESVGQDFIEREDWQQILFLCSDHIVFSFWSECGEGHLHHQHISTTPERAFVIPGLRELWIWKNLGCSWAELKKKLRGTPAPDGRNLN